MFTTHSNCGGSPICSQVITQMSTKYYEQTQTFANRRLSQAESTLESMYKNRLCEETIFVHLTNMKDIEIAKKQKWISQYPNDN